MILQASVVVDDKVFTSVVGCKVDFNPEEIKRQATVDLPLGYLAKKELFKRGAKVTIKLGYESCGFTREFIGFLDEVVVRDNLVLRVADYSFKFDGKAVNNIIKGSAPGVVKALLGDVVLDDSANNEVNKFNLCDKSIFDALGELKDYMSFNCFWLDDKPYFVKPNFVNPDGVVHKFDFSRDLISSDLTFREAKKGAVLVVSQNNEKTIKVKVGDGEVVKRVKANNLSEGQALAMAEDIYRERSCDGFNGSFVSFGYPFVRFGDVVEITDKRFREREGKFVVVRVVVKYGNEGFRREIYLGKRV